MNLDFERRLSICPSLCLWSLHQVVYFAFRLFYWLFPRFLAYFGQEGQQLTKLSLDWRGFEIIRHFSRFYRWNLGWNPDFASKVEFPGFCRNGKVADFPGNRLFLVVKQCWIGSFCQKSVFQPLSDHLRRF